MLSLGDSYTIGQSVSSTATFPAQTANWLNAYTSLVCGQPQIIATTGWTTTNLQNAIATQNPQGPYDIVTLLIGVNDQYQRQDTGSYRFRFTQLLIKSISLANGLPKHVFVLSIPDYSVTPFAASSDTARIRREIDFFNSINKDVSTVYGVNYLDITPSTRMAKNDPSLLAPDGLHPSGVEYKKWAERLGPQIKEALQ